MSRALAMMVVLLCAAGCSGDDPPERRAQPPEGVRLTCDDAIPRDGTPRSTRGSIRLGPVELGGLGRLDKAAFVRRGGVKIPLLIEPWQSVTIRIIAQRGALGFIPQPLGVFPAGRPSSPLPDESSSTLTTEGCAPRPGADPRSFLPSFIAIARPACARFEVRDARGSVARRTVAIGAGRCPDEEAMAGPPASQRILRFPGCDGSLLPERSFLGAGWRRKITRVGPVRLLSVESMPDANVDRRRAYLLRLLFPPSRSITIGVEGEASARVGFLQSGSQRWSGSSSDLYPALLIEDCPEPPPELGDLPAGRLYAFPLLVGIRRAACVPLVVTRNGGRTHRRVVPFGGAECRTGSATA